VRIKRPTLRNLVKMLEQIFVVVALLVFSGGFVSLMRRESGFESGLVEGDPVLRVIYFIIYFIALGFMLLRWKTFLRSALRCKLLWLLLVLVLLSALWAPDKGLSLRRGIAVFLTSIFGLYFAARFTIQEQIKLLTWFFVLVVISSFVFVFILPEYGIYEMGKYGTVLRGIFTHKNTLGRIAALIAGFFLLFTLPTTRWRWRAWAWMTLALALLFFSRSAGALVAFTVLAILHPFYKTLRWNSALNGVIYSGVLVLAMGVSIVVINNLEAFFDILGRDATLTGRTDLWKAVVYMIMKRPLLGYGYSGFWLGEGSTPNRQVWLMTGWQPSHAHNGFLDLGLALGSIGIILFLMTYFVAFVRAIKLARVGRSVGNYWPLMYLVFMVVTNLVEASILKSNDVFWVLYVAVLFTLAQYSRERVGFLTNPAEVSFASG